jgi:hypothetical protein
MLILLYALPRTLLIITINSVRFAYYVRDK